jgi:hypothetical protein
MSLTSFLKMPAVATKIKPLRPKLSRKIAGPLKVEPRTKNYTIVGTAFDYLLRFELQRRVPHAIADRLVAESAPDLIWQPGYWLHLPMEVTQGEFEDPEEVAKNVADRARNVVEKAKAALSAYVKMKEPDHSAQADLAAHAIRLAKLDEMCRALQLNPTFEEADSDDVEDLLALLAIVPFHELIHPQRVLLNPLFGETFSAVGGADADLITGDMLVDFKTTKSDEMQVVSLDQLLGYYLLARQCRRSDPSFPVINRLALYFCRHGILWSQEASRWTNHPQFSEIEEWFLERAKTGVGAE